MAVRKIHKNKTVLLLNIPLLLFITCQQSSVQNLARPTGRGYHAMAYDAESNRVILFGGITGDFRLSPNYVNGETWSFNPDNNRWKNMNPSVSPPPLTSHAMVYDKGSDRVILYGGMQFGPEGKIEKSDETWAYDLNDNVWTKMSDGPPARSAHRMAYHVKGDRIVLFGGSRSEPDTWTYDFDSDTWKAMNPPQQPRARVHAGLCYDASIEKILLWGGWCEGDQDSSVWLYDLEKNEWMEKASQNPPNVLDHFAMAYDGVEERIVVYGGSRQMNMTGTDEMWAYSSNTNIWNKIENMNSAGPLSRMPIVPHQKTGELLLFGGQLDSRQFAFSDATWSHSSNLNQWKNITVRKGSYLGQVHPGDTPETFSPGLVSSSDWEHAAPQFSPDGNEVHWAIVSEGIQLVRMRCVNDSWSEREYTPFAEGEDACYPWFSQDGSRLYFISYKLLKEGEKNPGYGINLWFVDRSGEEWSDPIPVGYPFNNGNIFGFSIAESGTIYYTDGTDGAFDIYRSELIHGKYTKPEKLSDAVNSSQNEDEPFIAPDESYLIFKSMKPDGYGQADLYVSFRNSDGSWKEARNLGPSINTEHGERFPSVTRDGKLFFFGSNRNGDKGDIFWMDASILNLNQK